MEFDIRIRKFVKRRLPRLANSRWVPSPNMVRQISLTLGDQQLVTGTSIMIAVYSRMCEISQYHFFLATSLASASFACFQGIVMISRPLLERKRFMRGWRLLAMLVVTVMGTVSNFIIWSTAFLTDGLWGQRTECILSRPEYDGYSIGILAWLTLNDVQGTAGLIYFMVPELRESRFIQRCQKLLSLPLEGVLKMIHLSVKLLRKAPELERRGLWLVGYLVRLWVFLTYAACLVFFFLLFAAQEIWFSVNLFLVLIFTNLVLTASFVNNLRTYSKSQDMQGNEDEWGFGQILPLVFLALPLCESIEIYLGTY